MNMLNNTQMYVHSIPYSLYSNSVALEFKESSLAFAHQVLKQKLLNGKNSYSEEKRIFRKLLL